MSGCLKKKKRKKKKKEKKEREKKKKRCAFLTPIKAKKLKLAVDSRGSAIPCRWFLHQWHKFMFGTNEVIHCFNWSLLLGLEGVSSAPVPGLLIVQ